MGRGKGSKKWFSKLPNIYFRSRIQARKKKGVREARE